MKRNSILFLAAIALASCGGTQSPASGSSIPEASGDSTASSLPSSEPTSKEQGDYLFYKLKDGESKDGLEGAPWVNSVKEGIGKKLVKPSEKDDFYLNKTYDMQATAVLEPGDMAVGGMPGAIKEVSKRTTRMLCEKTSSAYSDALNGVYGLYAKADKSAEETYVKNTIDEIKAIGSLDAMAEYLYRKGYDAVWPLFEIMRFGKGQLILKEENMGLTPSSVNYSYLYGTEEEKQRVIDTAVYLFGLYGYDEAKAKELLQVSAAAYRDATNQGTDVQETSVGEIDALFPHLKLKDYFATKLGYAATTRVKIDTNVTHLLKAISASWQGASPSETSLTLEQIKAILIFRAGFVSAISRPLSGDKGYIALTEGLNDNTRGFNDDMHLKDIFSSFFKDVYDRVYVDNYETKQRRESIISLMKEVTGEYKALLKSSSWLDESTRAAAVDKLDAMSFDACYPVSLESLPAWNLNAASFMEAVDAYSAWSRKADQPTNENAPLWAGTVTTVNGVYSPIANAFVIYDGLLASSAYGANMAKEELYGPIGTVIGHEISHAFDVQGAKYDKHGAQSDWWTKKDKDAYAAKVAKIKDVWSTYENKPGMKLSCSEDMLGEIIADMGGVSVCLRLGEKTEGFDYGKFFSSYASMHGSIMSEAVLENLIYGGESGKQDSHPLGVFRVNGVVNQFEKFYQTYAVKDGDMMYVAPDSRLNIWG